MISIQLKPLNQQVVAVIGASSGIGRVTALKLADRGAKLVLSSRSLPGLTSLMNEIMDRGGEAIVVPADVADDEQVKSIADKAIAYYGRIDTWVHAAATGVLARFEDITPAEFRRVIDVVLMGQVYGAMVALPHLKREGRGAFISITSVEARRSLPLQSPYSAAKHGVEGFLEAIRVELQHDKIPVSITNILPSVINTPYYNKAKTKLGVKPTGIPPYYEPEIVADAILYAAEHPTRDMIVGDSGRVLDVLQKLSPQLVDLLLAAVAISGQHTQEIKSEDDNNLYDPATEQYDRVEGDFSHLVIPSFLDWLDMNPLAKLGGAVGLGALALLATQVLKSSSQQYSALR